ncbi:hypothetical protein NE235_28240 [Actinoallomurus spadix]|uniref:hypothetical protein n=1 Tax=Actinoallomurus spadix TaxID=79912 RepID=UPI002091EF3B|nr:hypothetical protein [Actinoallomurus spadix]MCO5990010.1 hypothetical protein [Actinoallomurus spadix]
MSDLGRVLRIDARRTALFLAVPALAFLGAVAAWRALLPGVAYWDDAVAALFSSVCLLGPASAGFAAWVALREHRLDYLRGLTARSPALGPLLDLLLLGIVTLCAYTVVAAVVAAKTMIHVEAGHPRPIGPLAGALTLLVYTVVGYLAGRVLPRLPVVPAVAVLTYLWGAVRPGAWADLLPPPGIGHIGLFAALRTELLAGQALWAFGLGAVLVTGYLWALTRRAWLALPAVAAAGVVAGTTVWLHGQQRTPPVVPRAFSYACRQWPLTVCVHPALRAALPSLEAGLTPLATRLSGTPGRFTRVEHRPDNDFPRPGRGVVYIHLGDLSPGYAHRAEQEIDISLLDARTCGDPAHAAGAHYSALISAWLLDEAPPRLTDTVAADRFARWDEQRRRRWLHAHYARYRTCTLRGRDFRER